MPLARLRFPLVVVALILGLGTTSRLDAADPFEFIFALSADLYQSEFSRLTSEGYRPLTTNADEIDGNALFCALFVKDGRQVDWLARHNVGAEAFDKLREEQTQKGFRPISLAAYAQQGRPMSASVWVRDGGRRPWQMRLGMTSAQLTQYLTASSRRGLRPLTVTASMSAAGPTYSALLGELGRREFREQLELLEPQAQQAVREAASRGLRPLWISSWPSSRGTRFALMFVKDGVEANVQFGLSDSQLRAAIDAQRNLGLRPVTATTYLSGRQRQFAVIFERPSDSLPVTGEEVPSLGPFDEAMQNHLRDVQGRGATLAVSRNGRLLLSRGYGFRDAEELEPMPPDAILRIASLTKPITAMAARKLIRDGKLSLGDAVIDRLAPKLVRDVSLDPLWKTITVQHLLEHKGGWDRSQAKPDFPNGFDPMFQSVLIARDLGVTPPLRPEHFVRYMMRQSLDFTPGTQRSYSNFGYCLLGRVIEHASAIDYGEYLQRDIFRPLGVKDVRLGRSSVEGRDPREPIYHESGEAVCVLDSSGRKVRWPDGGFLLEGMDAHGGLIASAPELIKVFDAYWMSGEPRLPNESQSWVHFGSLPGCYCVAMQRPDGVNIVVLMNQRTSENSRDERIRDLMNAAADKISEWP